MSNETYDNLRAKGWRQLPNGEWAKAKNAPAVLQAPPGSPEQEGKPQRGVERQSVDRQKRKKKDAGDRRRYRVRITFGMADYRVRDVDGMFATVVDCLVRARRRLLGGDS